MKKSWLVLALALGCSGSGSTDPMQVASAVNSGVSFPGFPGAMKVNTPMPNGNTTTLTVVAGTSTTPPTMLPGQPFSIPIAWSGGGIGSANIGFGAPGAPAGGSSATAYAQVPLANMSTMMSGSVGVTAMVSGKVCDNLASTCHMIRCYEQVTLPDGTTVSKAAAQQIVLDCTMGKGCPQVALPDGFASSCTNTGLTCPGSEQCLVTGACPAGHKYQVCCNYSTGTCDVITDTAQQFACSSGSTNTCNGFTQWCQTN